MLEVTIFYILASFFLLIVIVFTTWGSVYLIKILKNLSDSSGKIKEMVSSFKEKTVSLLEVVSGFSRIWKKKKSEEKKKND